MTQRIAILLAFLYLVFIQGSGFTKSTPLFAALYTILLVIVLLAWLVALLRHKRPLPTTPLDVPLAIYAVLLVTSSLLSDNARVAFEQSLKYIIHIVWLYILVDLMRIGRQREIFEGLFLTVGCVVLVSLFEFASWYLGLGFLGYEVGFIEAAHGLEWLLPPYTLVLVLSNSVLLANFVLTTLPLIFTWSLTAKRADNRLGLRLLAIGALWVLIFTDSRGALLGLAAAASTLGGFWLWRRFALPRRYLMPAFVAGLVLIFVAGMTYTIFSGRESDRRREDMWASAAHITQEQPLLGAGVYQFGVEYRTLRDRTIIQDKIVSAHNLLMNTTAEIGLGGILLLGWLAAAFLRMWWQKWQDEHLTRQIRLEGVLASLAAFTVHSAIDFFSISALVLPVLVGTAYVLAGEYTPHSYRPTYSHKQTPYKMRYAILLGIIAYAVWSGLVTVGHLRFSRAIALLAADDYDAALTQIDRAAAVDPTLQLYDLQTANITGILAYEDPDSYLDTAINLHVETLAKFPTFDLGHSNLAALYAQKGDYHQAVESIHRAIHIHPDVLAYHIQAGEYYAALGDTENAIFHYKFVLRDVDHDRLYSAYWRIDEPVRQAAMQATYQNASPSSQLYLATAFGWDERAAELAAAANPTSEPIWRRPLARYYLHQGEYAAALPLYNAEIPTLPPSLLRSTLYAERAEAHYHLGMFDAALEDAYLAMLLAEAPAPRALYIRALVLRGEADPATINDLLVRAVPPIALVQEYASVLFGRDARLEPLPQFRPPRYGTYIFEPWLLLAERYAQDDDPDTDPQEVYDAIERFDPYTAAALRAQGLIPLENEEDETHN